jgi:putative SOS response-associated peptidase YedK
MHSTSGLGIYTSVKWINAIIIGLSEYTVLANQKGGRMCGRFTLATDSSELQAEWGLDDDMPSEDLPRYNIAPSQPVMTVRDVQHRAVEMLRWGLIPSWAKDPAIGNQLINARAETITEKPSFKQAFARRRCLIFADGFYEWKKFSGRGLVSQPYYFQLNSKRPFAFAGLWESWRAAENQVVQSCTIITTQANEVVGAVHERMPVILTPDTGWNWLAEVDPIKLLSLLKPFPSDLMYSIPVSRLVNRPEIDQKELIQPIDLQR